MFSKHNGRFFIFILASIALITGAYLTHHNRTHLKSSYTVEAATGLANYTVKEGDSIFTIAGKFGVSISALKHTNGLETEKVAPGQVLTIPNEPSGDWYTVGDGDSLYSIANKYNVTVFALKKVNGLASDLISPHQVLVIPSAKTVAEEKPTEIVTPDPKMQPVTQSVSAQPENTNRPLWEILQERGLGAKNSNLVIFVDKSARLLSLYVGDTRLKSYPIDIGDGGLGDKEVQGDHKTPEGSFYVSEKSILRPADKFLGTRWLRISYPNIEDANRGLQKGLIDQNTHDTIVNAFNNKEIPPQYTALGGGVGIHGGASKEQGTDWTFGCVGLHDRDVEDFFDFVQVGTPIYIQQ